MPVIVTSPALKLMIYAEKRYRITPRPQKENAIDLAYYDSFEAATFIAMAFHAYRLLPYCC
jgi:hypothetical protein